jgi:hypothetical protein
MTTLMFSPLTWHIFQIIIDALSLVMFIVFLINPEVIGC